MYSDTETSVRSIKNKTSPRSTMRAHTSTADQAPWCTSGRPRTSGDCHTKPPPQLIPHKNPSPAGEKRTHIASGQQNAAVARKCCQVASAVASCSGCAVARSKGRGSPCDPGLHLVGGGVTALEAAASEAAATASAATAARQRHLRAYMRM